MKALLSLRLTVDHADLDTSIYSHVKLYNEADGFIWRIGGELGDECETLPRPISIEQAKIDARALYPKQSPFHPSASWL